MFRVHGTMTSLYAMPEARQFAGFYFSQHKNRKPFQDVPFECHVQRLWRETVVGDEGGGGGGSAKISSV